MKALYGISLAHRLTRPLLVAVVTVWGLSTAIVAWYVDARIQQNFDAELIESAQRQLYPALLELRQVPPLPEDSPQRTLTMGEVPGDDHPEPLLLQLRASNGHVLLRSRGAPSTAFDAPLKVGFHSSVEHRIYTLHSPHDDLWLQLADPLAERAQIRRDTLSGLMAILLVMLPILAALIHHIAKRELRSVQWLQQQITQRSSSNLEPLELHNLPLELHHVGDGVNQLLARLHDALDVERALAANAAHELRTPLAAVRLRLHTAIEQAAIQGNPQITLADAQSALQALETLSHRTERLLQLSRAEAGDTSRFHAVDLVQLASTMAQEFWQQARAQRRLDWEPPEPGKPVWIHGDLDTLAIALRNLIENALTYSVDEVTLMVRAHPPMLAVRDRGPGLTSAQSTQILQRHVRADARHIGYGLGMSIVRTIADRHQATLELQSPAPNQTQGLEVRLVFAPINDPITPPCAIG